MHLFLYLHSALQAGSSCYPESPETASGSRRPSAPLTSSVDFRAGVVITVVTALVHISTTFPHSVS